MTQRSKSIRNASIAALAAAVLAILVRQQLDPDSPLSIRERQIIAELRSRFNRGKKGATDGQAKALAAILKKLSEQQQPTGMLSKYLYEALTNRLLARSWVVQDLLDKIEEEAEQRGE